ncbi:hypothetical protein [Fodinicola feengrottensis]|uniref:hypothetical protein n=1 Tax=Fodinicola feengrottensis TaxID=435914 RepID=UPI0013D319EF|nr:hypothetical protein [Fodinicola feengrottensis]
MQHVYAVESGSYSDYEVTHIFATRELAQDACDKINLDTYNDAEVVERPLLDQPLTVGENHTVSDSNYDSTPVHNSRRVLRDQTESEEVVSETCKYQTRNGVRTLIHARGSSAVLAHAEYDRLARARAEAAGIV